MQFQENIGEKTRIFFPVSLFQEPILPRKIPGCTPLTFSLTFHPNFHPIILVFANLMICRKLIHDNISLVFWKGRIFYFVLFWSRNKILFVHINIYSIETLASVILKKILFLFINISIIIFVSVILKKIKIIIILIYLRCCKYYHKV